MYVVTCFWAPYIYIYIISMMCILFWDNVNVGMDYPSNSILLEYIFSVVRVLKATIFTMSLGNYQSLVLHLNAFYLSQFKSIFGSIEEGEGDCDGIWTTKSLSLGANESNTSCSGFCLPWGKMNYLAQREQKSIGCVGRWSHVIVCFLTDELFHIQLTCHKWWSTLNKDFMNTSLIVWMPLNIIFMLQELFLSCE